MEKEKKDAKSKSSSTSSSTKNKKKKPKTFSTQINYKLCKVYNIMDELLMKYRNNIDIDNNLTEPFKVHLNIYK